MCKEKITVCSKHMCAGCMLCTEICPAGAIKVSKEIEAYDAVIDDAKCRACKCCRKLCPQNHPPKFQTPVEWYQGWSTNVAIRMHGSSGGLAMAIAIQFIEDGGEVCACRFRDGGFGFAFYQSTKEIMEAAGSKYVKSDPTGIYKPLLKKLRMGRKVLMIGLPCQVAAVINMAGDLYAEKLYTIDLICHGTPAPELLRTYLKSKDIRIDAIQDISFRRKSTFYLQKDYKVIEQYHIDSYTFAFLTALSYTENCYKCNYAKLQRISDITLGDSWESDLPKSEQKKGISLILCQSDKGKELLKSHDLQLHEVDLESAVAANGQLQNPSSCPKARIRFLSEIRRGRNFDTALYMAEPMRGIKNLIKKIVLRKKYVGGVKSDYILSVKQFFK